MRRQYGLHAAMALALAASMRSVGMVLPSNAPRLPLPPAIREMSRRNRKRLQARTERAIANNDGRSANRKNRLWKRQQNPDAEDKAAAKVIINRMTNWQRNQWARAGYPGVPTAGRTGYDLTALRNFDARKFARGFA